MAAKTTNYNVHPSIQRDRQKMWHPQLEIRQRGMVIYAITALERYPSPWRAQQSADTEAQRMVQQNG
jgi:hypothetical protein